MSNIPTNLKYTAEHEWVIKESDDIVRVGISDFAQSELGDIVYVEVETVGDHIEKDEIFGAVEAVKTTSDLFMPMSGEIIEFNPTLDESEGDDPAVINEDPYEKGWIIKIKISDASQWDELLDAEAYGALIG